MQDAFSALQNQCRCDGCMVMLRCCNTYQHEMNMRHVESESNIHHKSNL